MTDEYRLWKREEARRKQREGLAGRGITSCLSFLVSLSIAAGIFWWLSQNYNWRRLLNIPGDWPKLWVDIGMVILLFIAVQTILTVLLGIVWRLRGKDKKVRDKLRDLGEHWDQQ